MIGYQFLIETSAINSSGVDTPLYFCCKRSFTGGGKTWHPHIEDPGLYQTTLFSGGKTTGSSSQSYGEIIIGNYKNTDTLVGPMDWLKDYTFNGNRVTLSMGLVGASYPSGFTRVYTAIIESMSVKWDSFVLALKGIQSVLDVPYTQSKFLGTNDDMTVWLEGGEDLKDSLKPVLIGRVKQGTPVLCNTGKLIYAVSPSTGISVNEMGAEFKVYDNGVELACCGVLSTADLITNPPFPGTYYASTGGYIRLGSSPVGVVTFSGASAGHALTAKPSTLITAVLTANGYNSGDTKDMVTSNTFLNYTDTAERGLYIQEETNISDIIDSLLSPVGYWYFDKMGIMICKTMEDPAGKTPVYTVDSTVNIASIAFRKNQDTENGVPASNVTIKYSKNYTINTNPAGSVSVDFKTELSKEWLEYSMPASNTPSAVAKTLTIETALTRANESVTSLLHSFHTVDRELVDVELLPAAFLTAKDILPGQIVALNLHNRFYYSSTPKLVVAVLLNCVEETVNLTLWG